VFARPLKVVPKAVDEHVPHVTVPSAWGWLYWPSGQMQRRFPTLGVSVPSGHVVSGTHSSRMACQTAGAHVRAGRSNAVDLQVDKFLEAKQPRD
jgi:hypothetical protein